MGVRLFDGAGPEEKRALYSSSSPGDRTEGEEQGIVWARSSRVDSSPNGNRGDKGS